MASVPLPLRHHIDMGLLDRPNSRENATFLWVSENMPKLTEPP